ncbi:MAG: secretion protein [Cryomorphaceae bacterium]|nr:secretion protein [Cryomorphaceae bacterium]
MNKCQVILSIVVIVFLKPVIFAQSFAPEPEEIGSDAIHKDSSIFVGWANDIVITRGPMNIEDPSLGLTNYGVAENGNFIADNSVVSLGDGGQAIATFSEAIGNGPGPDFAIFENGFANHYMELAFVEVSSNGINYSRFESISETPTDVQIDNFSYSDCRYLYNLAGKYRVYFGTPFDLEELSGIAGLNINNITHIRIIDVVGSISSDIASYDSQGNVINDPYPTPFESGGFDLDAIGVIHNAELHLNELNQTFEVFPNPTKHQIYLKGFSNAQKYITDINGKLIAEFWEESYSVSNLSPGLYFLKQGTKTVKFMKQ